LGGWPRDAIFYYYDWRSFLDLKLLRSYRSYLDGSSETADQSWYVSLKEGKKEGAAECGELPAEADTKSGR
jgi:hypothetical protein